MIEGLISILKIFPNSVIWLWENKIIILFFMLGLIIYTHIFENINQIEDIKQILYKLSFHIFIISWLLICLLVNIFLNFILGKFVFYFFKKEIQKNIKLLTNFDLLFILHLHQQKSLRVGIYNKSYLDNLVAKRYIQFLNGHAVGFLSIALHTFFQKINYHAVIMEIDKRYAKLSDDEKEDARRILEKILYKDHGLFYIENK